MIPATTIRSILTAIPPTLAMPASVRADSPIRVAWPILDPLSRLVVCRLFGRSADRNAVAGAWDVCKTLNITMRNLIDELPPSVVRREMIFKLRYVNRTNFEPSTGERGERPKRNPLDSRPGRPES